MGGRGRNKLNALNTNILQVERLKKRHSGVIFHNQQTLPL
jgi:hypothetical protein